MWTLELDLADSLFDAALDGDQAALTLLVEHCTEAELDALLCACRAVTRTVRRALRERTQARLVAEAEAEEAT